MMNEFIPPAAFTFDDVLLVPQLSEVQPSDVCVKTRLTKEIELNIPLISAAMDTVTTSNMAIAMAQAGGIGVIHKNMPIGKQVEEIRRVKRFVSGMVTDPITVAPETSLAEVLDLMKGYSISGIPVIDSKSQKVVGIITNRDVRFVEDSSEALVKDFMTHENLITVRPNVERAEVKRLLHEHRIERLIVVDDMGRCAGLITVKDIEKAILNPNANKDSEGRLRVAAAVGVGKDGVDRAMAMADAGLDLVVVDTAHGHSKAVLDTVSEIRQLRSNNIQVLAGNVATADGASALIDAGADAIKVGIGPGSICTTRIVAGVGIPQLSAIKEVAFACQTRDIPVVADGGIKYSGDIAKAIGAGANVVMVGSLLAGTDEAPGDIIYYQGRSYKSYRGMGSLGAMVDGSADRYGQDSNIQAGKLVPEGVEGRVPYKGPVANILYQLVGGLRSAMGYTGSADIDTLRNTAKFVAITHSGVNESHVHNVHITREAPNYRTIK